MTDDVTLNDNQKACLRTVRAMMMVNNAPEPSPDSVLTRALFLAAEQAHQHLNGELGTEERAEKVLKEARAYPFNQSTD